MIPINQIAVNSVQNWPESVWFRSFFFEMWYLRNRTKKRREGKLIKGGIYDEGQDVL